MSVFKAKQTNVMWHKTYMICFERKLTKVLKGFALYTSANPLMEIQREALILGNNMSSGVTVPIFGKKFAKMRQRE